MGYFRAGKPIVFPKDDKPMIINNEQMATLMPEDYYKGVNTHVTCADGTTLSVQASKYHYCTPRNNLGPYTHVEVGFPTAVVPETWEPYNDGDTGIYPWIPVRLVLDYIHEHGGMVSGALPWVEVVA